MEMGEYLQLPVALPLRMELEVGIKYHVEWALQSL
jgi:hypothetical protein